MALVGLYALCLVILIVAGKILHWLWTNRTIIHFINNLPAPYNKMHLRWTVRIPKYKNNLVNLITALYNEYGGTSLCGWFGPVPLFITTDLDIIQKVFTLPELQNKSILYDSMINLIDGGLVFISGKRWQHHRRVLNPSFHIALFTKFVEKFNRSKDIGVAEIRELADGSERQLEDLMIFLSMRTTLDASFDVELPKQTVYDLSYKISFIIKDFLWRVVVDRFNLNFLDIFDGTTLRLLKEVKTTMTKIVEEKKSELYSSLATEPECDSSVSSLKAPKILLHQCLELHRTNEFTMDDVMTEVQMVMGASFDTTGITMYSALVLLALHPEVQERAFEEVASVFPNKDFHMEYEHVNQLPYLDMIIKETMRLCPAIVHIARDVPVDVALNKNITFPKGLQILIPIVQLHRRKDIWGDDANAFDPDRFLPENAAKIHPYAYVPFSKGIRNCIGWRYAEVLMAIVLAALIRNFKFASDVKYEDIKFESGIVIKYKNPPLLRIYPREN